MSCRHDLANTTCSRCYPDRGGLDSNGKPQINPGPGPHEPNLDGPGAAPPHADEEVASLRAAVAALTAERDNKQSMLNVFVKAVEMVTGDANPCAADLLDAVDKLVSEREAARAERDTAPEGQRKADGDYHVVAKNAELACQVNAGATRSLTRERDASITACEKLSKELQAARADRDEDRFLLGEVNAEVARLREENAALKANIVSRCERVFNGFGQAGMAAELKQASDTIVEQHRAHAATKSALGQSRAVLLKLEAFHNFALSYSGEGAALRGEITGVLADPEGRAAVEYVKESGK